MSPQDKLNLVNNIVGSMKGIAGPLKMEIINRQLCHFFRADKQLGEDVAHGLGIRFENHS